MTTDQLFLIGLVIGQMIHAVTHIVIARRSKRKGHPKAAS